MLSRRYVNGPVFGAFGQREVNQLLNSMFRPVPVYAGACGCSPSAQATPAGLRVPLNAWEDESNVYVEMEVPGIAMEALDISFTGGELAIKGSRTEGPAPEGVVFHRRERAGTLEFARTIEIAVPIVEDAIGATLNGGVLLVTLPKAPEAKPRKIAVSVK